MCFIYASKLQNVNEFRCENAMHPNFPIRFKTIARTLVNRFGNLSPLAAAKRVLDNSTQGTNARELPN